MLQKEFDAGKQFVKDIKANLQSNSHSDLFFDNNSFNMCKSEHKLKLNNSFDNINSLKQDNEFLMSLIKQMMTFFNKESKSEGNLLIIIDK